MSLASRLSRLLNGQNILLSYNPTFLEWIYLDVHQGNRFFYHNIACYWAHPWAIRCSSCRHVLQRKNETQPSVQLPVTVISDILWPPRARHGYVPSSSRISHGDYNGLLAYRIYLNKRGPRINAAFGSIKLIGAAVAMQAYSRISVEYNATLKQHGMGGVRLKMSVETTGKELKSARRPPGGGYLTKFNTGRLRPEVQPLTLLYTILAEKVPLLYTFYWKRYPFHIPTLPNLNVTGFKSWDNGLMTTITFPAWSIDYRTSSETQGFNGEGACLANFKQRTKKQSIFQQKLSR